MLLKVYVYTCKARKNTKMSVVTFRLWDYRLICFNVYICIFQLLYNEHCFYYHMTINKINVRNITGLHYS